MRIPNERHLALDLRIHEIVPDFTLEDVWLLPGIEGHGGRLRARRTDDARGRPGRQHARSRGPAVEGARPARPVVQAWEM